MSPLLHLSTYCRWPRAMLLHENYPGLGVGKIHPTTQQQMSTSSAFVLHQQSEVTESTIYKIPDLGHRCRYLIQRQFQLRLLGTSRSDPPYLSEQQLWRLFLVDWISTPADLWVSFFPPNPAFLSFFKVSLRKAFPSGPLHGTLSQSRLSENSN